MINGSHDFGLLKVDNDGNMNYTHYFPIYFSGYPAGWHNPVYTGKIADTFDFPYTVELRETSCDKTSLCKGNGTGTFTFNDASSGSYSIKVFFIGSGHVPYYDTYSGTFSRR